MTTGFEIDGQRIAQAQVRATMELAQAIRDLSRTMLLIHQKELDSTT